jgi:hypothetical protein
MSPLVPMVVQQDKLEVVSFISLASRLVVHVTRAISAYLISEFGTMQKALRFTRPVFVLSLCLFYLRK